VVALILFEVCYRRGIVSCETLVKNREFHKPESATLKSIYHTLTWALDRVHHLEPYPPPPVASIPSPPSAFVTLIRVDDVPDVVALFQSMESIFNHKWHYDYVVFNEGLNHTHQAAIRSAVNGSLVKFVTVSLLLRLPF
jgi:hypothetical protein